MGGEEGGGWPDSRQPIVKNGLMSPSEQQRPKAPWTAVLGLSRDYRRTTAFRERLHPQYK